ncbi:MAG: hypothetical protein ACOY4R_27740 [Pseudomonadota bacterium]
MPRGVYPRNRPGVPAGNHLGPDLSQNNAHEEAALAMEERERQSMQEYGGVDDDERIARDDSMEASRGGHERVFSPDEWDRANGPTDPERRRRLREMLMETLLPNLPKKSGWHRCWVSTSHPNDTPHRRVRLGYRFLRYDDMRKEGWDCDEYAVKDAATTYHGCIMWREMVGMECPEELFVDIMREVHHDAPLDQSRSIYDSLDAAGEEARARGGKTTMEPGMAEMIRYVRPPRQFE